MAKKFNQLIWLGAGNATEPKGLLEQAVSSVLVEARESAVKALLTQFNHNKTVTVKHCVIGTGKAEQSFYHYNLAEFSGLHKVTGLSQFFPGLKPVQQNTVTTEDVTDFLSQLKLTGTNNLLVLDCADISLALLQQLGADQLLSQFGQIMLVAGSIALYEGAGDASQLTELLTQYGFSVTAQDNTDPDLPWLSFTPNPLWLKLKQAEQREAELKSKLETQQQQQVAQAKQAEQREAELKSKLETQQQQQVAQAKQAEQREAELKSKLETQQQQQVAQAKQAEQREAELKSKLETQQQQQAAQAKQAEQREAELRQQLDVFNQQLLKLQQQTEQLNQEYSLATKSNKDLREQLSAVTVGAEKKQAELVACLSGKDAELSALSEQWNTDRSALATLTEQHNSLKTSLGNTQAALQLKEQELTRLQTEYNGQLAKLKTELEHVSKHAAQRLEKVTQLEKSNRQLNETNEQLVKKQRLLEQEMLKAEAQIDIIKELVLRQ
jgi:chemotaxis protein histidine kinase CheA